jgi:hypothetical protein
MNYFVEFVVSDALIYIPRFIKFGAVLQKLTGRIHTQTQTAR